MYIKNIFLQKIGRKILKRLYLKFYKSKEFTNAPHIYSYIQINKEKDLHRVSILYQSTKTILDILGIMPLYSLGDETLIMYRQWEEARQEKNFQLADQLRDQLSKRGWM